MIQNYWDYKKFIRSDLKSQDKKLNVKSFLFDALVRFTFLLRFNEYLLNSKKSMIVRFFWLVWFKRLSIKLGFSIPLNVFDSGLGIVHYGLLIINPRAKIGKNCRIHAGVNIGGAGGFIKKIDKKVIYAPKIGHNCYIGPGAKLFGGIRIGNNCVIGANSVVNKSFDKDNITVAGVPAKIISEKGSKGFLIEGAEIE